MLPLFYVLAQGKEFYVCADHCTSDIRVVEFFNLKGDNLAMFKGDVVVIQADATWFPVQSANYGVWKYNEGVLTQL